MFDVQNRKGVRVFFVRFVIREWNDETAVKILKNVGRFSVYRRFFQKKLIILISLRKYKKKNGTTMIAFAGLVVIDQVNFG